MIVINIGVKVSRPHLVSKDITENPLSDTDVDGLLSRPFMLSVNPF